MKCPTCGQHWPKRSKAICPECGKLISLNQEGRFYTHRHPLTRHRTVICIGSRTKAEGAKV